MGCHFLRIDGALSLMGDTRELFDEHLGISDSFPENTAVLWLFGHGWLGWLGWLGLESGCLCASVRCADGEAERWLGKIASL